MLELRAKHKDGRSCRYECLVSAIKSGFKPQHIYTSIKEGISVDGYEWSIIKGGTFKDHIIKEFHYREDNRVIRIVKSLGLNNYIVNKVLNEYLK